MAFWVAIIGVPLVVILTNAAIRSAQNVPQTIASDVWALFVVFDATMVLQSHDFAKMVTPSGLAAEVVTIGLLAMLICVIMWMVSLMRLEPELVRVHNARTPANRQFPFKLWCIGWSGILAMLALHTALFTGRLPWF